MSTLISEKKVHEKRALSISRSDSAPSLSAPSTPSKLKRSLSTHLHSEQTKKTVTDKPLTTTKSAPETAGDHKNSNQIAS